MACRCCLCAEEVPLPSHDAELHSELGEDEEGALVRPTTFLLFPRGTSPPPAGITFGAKKGGRDAAEHA